MKERDIRPADLIAENELLHDMDIKRLFPDSKSFLSVECPACEDTFAVKEFNKKSFSFMRCHACETLYVNPRPAPQLLNDFYSAPWMKHWNDKIFPVSEQSRREKIFYPRAERVVELCKKYTTGANTLVDVGAGFGTFCEEMAKLSYFKNILAVEPSQDLAQTCRTKGINTIEKPIEEVTFRNIDVITSFELLEHLFSPDEFIRSCGNVLSQNGLLILTTPNIKGFDLLVLGALSENIAAPEHLNYFNPHSISLLLERCGFSAMEIVTPGKLDADIVRSKALAGVINLMQQPFLHEILIREWDSVGASFQKFLVENRLSSHMWVVAKKK